MKRGKNILVHDPAEIAQARGERGAQDPIIGPSSRLSLTKGTALGELTEVLRSKQHDILRFSGRATLDEDLGAEDPEQGMTRDPMAAASSRSSPDTAPLVTVGLWDLGAWLGHLNDLVEHLNTAQQTFVFYEVKATVPAGSISRPERVVPWLESTLGRELTGPQVSEIKDNLIANDYFELFERIRDDLGLDYLVGITPSMVAGIDSADKLYWNHFSTSTGRAILASTYQLRQFAAETGDPFERFLAVIIIAEMLVARFHPNLEFHPDTGCLFDYNPDRISIKNKVKNPRIEASCMEQIDAPFRLAATALVDFLRAYRGQPT